MSSQEPTDNKNNSSNNDNSVRHVYAPTAENVRALGNGIELSKATRRLLDQAERRQAWKDSARKVIAAKNIANNLGDDDENNHKSSHKAVAIDNNENPRASSSSRRKQEASHVSKGLSWPVVLDRVVMKRRSSAHVATRKGKDEEEADPDCNSAETNAEILAKELQIMDEEDNGQSADGEETCSVRRDLLRLILGWKFEVFLLLLLACDVILLIVELELQTRVVCHIAWDRSVSSVSVPAGNPFLASPSVVNCTEAEDLEMTCETTRTFSLPKQFAVCPFTVNEELPHAVHTAEIVINWVSRVILIFFALEIIGLVACSGFTILWRHKLYLLDFLIVSVSIALDIISALLHLDRASELIVIARVWRFARIVHGVGVSVHDVDEHEMEDEEEYLDEKDEIVEQYFPGSSPKLKAKEAEKLKHEAEGAKNEHDDDKKDKKEEEK